jgi:hypothetical protein
MTELDAIHIRLAKSITSEIKVEVRFIIILHIVEVRVVSVVY